MVCDKLECKNVATHAARLILRATMQHIPLKSAPIFFLCEEHKDVDKIAMGFDKKENWENLAATFLAKGLAAPRKDISDFEVVPITQELIKERLIAIAMGKKFPPLSYN